MPTTTYYIEPGKEISWSDIKLLSKKGSKIALSEAANKAIVKCYEYLQKKMQSSDAPIYGINTGFGSLYKNNIPKESLEQLQKNLVFSHACGAGPRVPNEIVRWMLVLKVKSLSEGHSGVQLETVQRLVDFFNEDILPLVYEYGSLGASGDLAPLAHLTLPLLNEGQVEYKGQIISGEELNKKMGWEPITLKAKEGLALLNGTQFMSAYGISILLKGKKLSRLADIIGAISLEGFDGRIDAFDDKIHQIRKHKGQIETAKVYRQLLEGSEIITREKHHVQDPYSFRCIPQVHGATKDTINYVENIFMTEINGVTDNPNIFPDEDEILSGGNFHGQPLALGLDYIAIALAELGSISERRTFQLISGTRNLPDFLVANPGLNSGLMITQYTAAAIVSLNKQLCSPSSVDSIVSSNGQEDHVSMGANAAIKAYEVIKNTLNILGIELITAAQALEFRRPLKSSPILEKFFSNFRREVSFMNNDRVLHHDMQKTLSFLENWD
jgi:histidine ammonia-lyase